MGQTDKNKGDLRSQDVRAEGASGSATGASGETTCPPHEWQPIGGMLVCWRCKKELR